MKTRTHFPLAALAAAFALSLSPLAEAQAPAAADSKSAKAAPAPKAKAQQRTFASPEDAAKALVDAVKAGDAKSLLEIVGPASKSWIFTGDDVSDRKDWNRFAAAYEQKKAFTREGDSRAVLTTGSDDNPFAAPLVKGKDGQWTFDAEAGREELTNRRVGRNELDTIQTLLAIVDAQREYAAADADKNGFNDYARRFRSSEGKKDGLFWKVKAGEPPSPLGALAASASKEGYNVKGAAAEPYNGYHYRMLTRQGKDAPGGAYDYLVRDKLIGGFAIVAYPAKYGVSGVMSFIVNYDGVVYQKDLGAKTTDLAVAMKSFNPDKTWKKAQ